MTTIRSSLLTFFPTHLISLPFRPLYSKLPFQNHLRTWRCPVIQPGGQNISVEGYIRKGSWGVWGLRATCSGYLHRSDQGLGWQGGDGSFHAFLCMSHSEGLYVGLFDFWAMVLLPGVSEEAQAAPNRHLNRSVVLKGAGMQQHCRGTVTIRC